MDTERQFFELIRQRPEEDPPRLIYADWLDELGDPRGEFIRVQCELTQLPATDRAKRAILESREQSLLKTFRETWIRPLSTFHFKIRDAVFRRGLLQEVKLSYWEHPGDSPSQFPARWRSLIEREPGLTNVALVFYRDWSETCQLERTPQLRSLHFNHQALSRREVSTLLRWPVVEGISSLDFSFNNLRSGVECVAHSPSLDHLEELDLSWNQIGNRGARALATSCYLQSLRRLNLRGNCIGRQGKELLRIAFGPRVQL